VTTTMAVHEPAHPAWRARRGHPGAGCWRPLATDCGRGRGGL